MQKTAAPRADVVALLADNAPLATVLTAALDELGEPARSLAVVVLLPDEEHHGYVCHAAAGLPLDAVATIDALALEVEPAVSPALVERLQAAFVARSAAPAFAAVEAIRSARGDALGLCVVLARHGCAAAEVAMTGLLPPVRIAVEREHTRRQFTRYAQSLDQARLEAEQQATELAAARDEALAATRAKSDFLAMMSHEIRTPMNGIFGMTEIALDTDDADERRECLSRARGCAETLMALLNDILDLSKIEAGRLELERVEFEVRAVLHGVLDALAVSAARKSVEIVGLVAEDVPAVAHGDPMRLRQVLMNLAGNALKFTATGEVCLRIERLADVDGAAVLRCTVRDTGIGIPRERLAAIFDPFTQAEGSTAREHGGTGLGLTISQRRVGLMGGEIGVESTPGKGSTFWFTIAVEPVTRDTTAPPAHGRVAGLRALVVDDNVASRLALMRTLQDHDCLVVPTSSGSEACTLLEHFAHMGEPFDVVLLDLQMPGVDGVTIARRIRASQVAGGVPIVALTTVGRRPTEADGAPFAGVLVKPVKAGELLATVATALPPPLPAAVAP